MFVPAWPGQRCSLGYQVGLQVEADLGVELTGEQRGRVVDYYELDPRSGRRVVRRAALRRPKGAGKSPEGGYLAFAELCCPVLFDGWVDGQPVGRLHPEPWVQLAAVSEDQTDNVMVWLFEQLADRPDMRARRGIDLGRSRVYLTDRPGRIEPVTAAAGSREGQRVTFAVLDQTEAWTRENGGRRLADTLRRNAAKMQGWTLELQNAPEPGDGSVADETARASEKAAAGVLFDDRPAPEVRDLSDTAALHDALRHAYGESAAEAGGWVDLPRLVDEIQDPATDPADARRYYLNQATPMARRAFDRQSWAACEQPGVVPDGELVVAGFDGSRFDDATALVACSVVSGRVWLVGLWESDGSDDWEVPEADVSAAVDELFDRWQVWRLYADPPRWEATVAAWSGRHRYKLPRPSSPPHQRVFEWWTNRPRQIGVACRNVAGAVRAGELVHGGDADLTRHMFNAVRRQVASRDDEGHPLWTLGKESPSRKIDAAMALVLAWEARMDALAAGAVGRARAKVAGF